MNIVVVGSLNMDLVVRIPQIPRLGETLLGGVFKTFPGGKGANQAVAAARLGGHVTMIGCVGDDSFGMELWATLAREGIETRHVLVQSDVATGVALIEVDGQGQNSIAVASGANLCLTSADVETAMQTIDHFDVLVMPLETPLETVYTAAQIASKRGAKVLLNPAPAQVLEESLLQRVDALIPNEHELALMTGVQVQTPDDIRRAAENLRMLGVKNLLVTLGSQGSAFFDSVGQETLIPAYPVLAVDTTAAGDCYVGALAVGLCEGKPIAAAAAFASAAAALSATREGAQPSLPHRDEVEEFLHERSVT